MVRTLTRGLVPPLLLGLGLGAGLAGCSGGDDPLPQKGSPTDATSSPSQTRSENTISPPNLPEPPAVIDGAGAVADVTYEECASATGTQSVSGQVTNPTKKTVSYVIVFNWTNDTSDVLGRGFAVVRDLGGAKTADWKLSAKVSEGATQCVPHAERGQVEEG